MSETNQHAELVLHQNPSHSQQSVSVFVDAQAFEHAQRISKMLASSDIVPEAYKGRIDNVMVALEMSNRMQVSPLMVMQNLDIIHGKPAFNSKFTAAMVNSCGKYTSLRYKIEGEGDKRTCVAYCKELATGEILNGPPVSVSMAKSEGWWTKKGSKWPTMTDLMLTYRAATFFCRVYEPGLTMGIPTTEELIDIADERRPAPGALAAINEKVQQKGHTVGTVNQQAPTQTDEEAII
jgi:hypothetical protein